MVGTTLALWLAFIATVTIVDDAKTKDDLNLLQKVAVLAFAIFDVVMNYTVFAIWFLELANNDRKTVTARLKYYLKTQPLTWRGKLATFFCKYMIEPWDFGHCAFRRQ